MKNEHCVVSVDGRLGDRTDETFISSRFDGYLVAMNFSGALTYFCRSFLFQIRIVSSPFGRLCGISLLGGLGRLCDISVSRWSWSSLRYLASR